MCSDCSESLVPKLPVGWKKADKWSPLPPKKFLAWFVPVSGLFPFVLLFVPTRFGQGNFNLLFWFVNLVCDAAALGSLWMIYQAVRYERRVGVWILLSLVPFMSIWYLLARYLTRMKLRPTEEEFRSDA